MNNLNSVMIEALKNYDNINLKYKKYIKNKNINKEKKKNEIFFNELNKTFKYQILGIFENYTNIWLWAWMIPSFTQNEIVLSKEILNYGLKQTSTELTLNENSFFKIQLVNSRFLVRRKFQIDLLLSIILLLLKKKILFIYKENKKISSDEVISQYLLIYE